MAGSLSGKARRLELARVVRGGATAPDVSLVWTSPGVRLDRTPGPGEHLVCDYVVTPGEMDSVPMTAIANERITRDEADAGVVYDREGREIGRVKRGRKGEVVLEFAWREELGAAGAAKPR